MTLSKNKTEEIPTKILIVGLDNSGKTSIVYSLKGIKNITTFSAIRPTRGEDPSNIEVLNSKYVIWDLGGQEAYREAYLLKISEYLENTSKIIFVIDIQDTNRYDEALDYMKQFVNSMKESMDFSIFLHKYDPGLEYNDKLNEEVISELIRKLKTFIPSKFFYSIFKTSIYAVFEKTSVT